MAQESKIAVTITSIDNPAITKTFNKANGLTSLSTSGLKNNPPSYDIVSKSGSVEIIDKDGWLREQSDNNIFPNVTIDIYIDEILHFSFLSDSEISYSRLDKKVHINLIDSINSLQNTKIEHNIVYTNTNAYEIFLNICSITKSRILVDVGTKVNLMAIQVPKTVVQKDTIWNVLKQFISGTRTFLDKHGEYYYLKRIEE
uniref:Uncharacterized protein n=1 Tax=virus sp. cti5L29 TaxID=2826813 RepID=A0A8S5R8C2_9VIRU|nr:MAG TPA: hypothetical protein [virus sp. cti5L29]